MNIVLASVIAFGLLVTACNAFCFTELPKMGQTEGCLYKDKLHRLGSKFRTNDCMDCTCHMDGKMACCQAYATPVEYDKEKCIAVFNRKACHYRVVEKRNRSKECEVLAMVG
ncbi:beta-microseminoprotein [Xenopus laevis]|uniref:Beta-microseminoprotein n=1 Tax=Xenopus laevis TaxID=8355 RepID=A0A8J1L827_XENLA|nr:beta-microseminoprotein [Xenopus laevis]XP_041424739.1 beta-microseminoprotein [Xenopus laevis]XP_041424740.1 beta-microseminoprotein [Xenopus laevis]